MPPATITATEAARNFSNVLRRARTAGEVIIEKNGRPYASLGPIRTPLTGAQILNVLDKRPRTRLNRKEAEAFARDVEASRKTLNMPPVSKW